MNSLDWRSQVARLLLLQIAEGPDLRVTGELSRQTAKDFRLPPTAVFPPASLSSLPGFAVALPRST